MKLGKKKLQELKENKSQIEDLNDRYFISSRYKLELENILKLLNENICNFKEIADKVKSIKNKENATCLYKLLSHKDLFEELIENNKLTLDDLEYLWNKIDKDYELYALKDNTFLLQYMIDNISFQEIVDKYKSMDCLWRLLYNEYFFKGMIENNKLTNKDLKYLLNEFDKTYELGNLHKNTPLIKCILNEFVLNEELADKFNKIIEEIDWCKRESVHTIFDYIEFYNKNNEEVLKLNELNRKVYVVNNFNFAITQKLELIEILKNNEIAQNRLKHIVDSNLENDFDFDSLKVYLKKKEKKNMLNI